MYATPAGLIVYAAGHKAVIATRTYYFLFIIHEINIFVVAELSFVCNDLNTKG